MITIYIELSFYIRYVHCFPLHVFYINKNECASVSLCVRKYFDKRVLNGGEYDIGWDYDWDDDI